MISRQHKIVMSLIIFQTFSHNVLRFSKSDVFLHSRYATKEPIHVMPAHTAFPSLSFSKFRVTCIHTYIYTYFQATEHPCLFPHCSSSLGKILFCFLSSAIFSECFPKNRHSINGSATWSQLKKAGYCRIDTLHKKKKKRMNFYTFTPLLVKDFKKTRTKSRLFVRLLSF